MLAATCASRLFTAETVAGGDDESQSFMAFVVLQVKMAKNIFLFSREINWKREIKVNQTVDC